MDCGRLPTYVTADIGRVLDLSENEDSTTAVIIQALEFNTFKE